MAPKQPKDSTQDLVKQDVGDVTPQAFSNPPQAPQTIESEYMQKTFQEAPAWEQALIGAGRVAKQTLIDPVKLGMTWLGGDDEELERQKEQLRQEQEGYNIATSGSAPAWIGETGADFALTALPAAGGFKLGGMARKTPGLVQNVVRGLGAGGGSAAVHDLQRYGSGKEFDPMAPIIETGFSGALPIAGKLVKGVAKLPGYLGKETAESIGNVPIEALEMWGTKRGRELLRSNWNKELPTAKDMVNKVFNAEKTLPEAKQIKKIISEMPDIPTERVLSTIKAEIDKIPLKQTMSGNKSKLEKLYNDISGKKEISGTNVPYTSKLQGEKQLPSTNVPYISKKPKYKTVIDPITLKPKKVLDESKITKGVRTISGKTVPEETIKKGKRFVPGKEVIKKNLKADDFRNKRIALDDLVDWDKPGATALNESLKKIGGVMRQELIEKAPTQYKPLMKSWANKENNISSMKMLLGNKKSTANQKAFSLLRTVDNQSRQPTKEIVQLFDDTFGTNFVEKAEIMHLGRQLGKAGKEKLEVPFLPKGATGNRVAAIMTAGIGTPATAPYALKALNAPSKGYDMTKNLMLKFPGTSKRVTGIGGQTLRSAAFGPSGIGGQ